MNIMQRLMPIIFAVLLCGLVARVATAENNFEFWPDADYDPTIPTLMDVLGYNAGERITWHRQAVQYFHALADASDGRLAIVRYAQSWEGRELIYVVVTSAENMAHLDDIKAGMQRLADPRKTTAVDAKTIIAEQPAVTWLSYGVHGNEVSPTDASMLTAYHLLASRDDPRVAEILRNTVVVIDPMQNPDGRDRFVHHYEASRGLLADDDPISAEHKEPWPQGRFNHYLFDLNRDWFVLTQPETQGRIRVLQEWYPVAFVDAHEMKSNSTYFFAPEATPYNPHLASDQVESLSMFGQNNARWFDSFGIDYFTREVYDAFYPGYGASWPSYFGSVAMTYEQASADGLVIRQYDGNRLSYRYTMRNHFIASLSAAETVANNRTKFLNDFYAYQVSAIQEGKSEKIRSYILPRQYDQAAADKLAGLLVAQGVEVDIAEDSIKACDKTYPKGTYVINLAQPAKRLIRTLMDSNVPIDGDFMAEQERRRSKKLPSEIYDVTAWSLPLMMNLQAIPCGRLISGSFTPAGPEPLQPGTIIGDNGSVAYLVPWGSAPAIRFLSQALQQGLSVKSTDSHFTHNSIHYPAGTLILDTADNPKTLRSILTALTAATGANAVAVDNSWVTDGPNFGSDKVVRHNLPKVAIAWDRPTSPPSAGNTRYVLERQFELPVTAIRTHALATADLSRYQVLILPESSRYPGRNYMAVLGEKGAANLKNWVKRGGVLISIGNANRYLTDPKVDLLSIRREHAVIESDQDGSENQDDKPLDATVAGAYVTNEQEYQNLITAENGKLDSVAGVLINADVDPDHWLSAGVAKTLKVLVRGSDVYTPIRIDRGINVARFRAADELLASGYIWEQNRKQLAYKPFVVAQKTGKGYVIGFTQNPNTRAYLDGLNLIFMNAVFRGAAHARPIR